MKDTITRYLIRIRHYKYRNKPIKFKNGKPVVWETSSDDTYLQTFYYDENNEFVVESTPRHWEGAIFIHKTDVMKYNDVSYDMEDIVNLLKKHLKPKKDYYIKIVTCETKIG